MRMLNWKSTVMWTALSLLFLLLALMVGPAPALAQSARLYELTENMKLIAKRHGTVPIRRTATSELMGFADVGTPLCPQALVDAVSPGATSCTINATGSDDVKLTTLKGTLSGRYTVVVQGDNPVDSPEYVVTKGKFSGKIDFGNVASSGFGTAEGTFTSDAGQKIHFNGTFRVPYLIFLDVRNWNRCDPTVGNPYCVQVTPKPVYTDLTGGNPLGVEVGVNEYSLGYPTVRFDITFD